MMIQQMLPPQKPLLYIMNTSQNDWRGNRSFHGIPHPQKGAALSKPGKAELTPLEKRRIIKETSKEAVLCRS